MHHTKYTLIACLGWSLAGGAAAQSNVQLPAGANLQVYGILNLHMSNYQAGDMLGGGSTWTLTDGTVDGTYGSRLGFKASKELGNGLKATALLEAGFGVDTGNHFQGGRLFGRQAYLSLASQKWGEIRAGRQMTAAFQIKGGIAQALPGTAADPGSPVGTANGTLSQWVDAIRIDNVVQYLSPKFGAFSFAVMGAPGERVNDQYQGVRLNYAEGKLTASFAREWNKDRVTHAPTNKVHSFAAAYDFSVAKVALGLQRASDLTTSPGNMGGATNLMTPGPFPFLVDKINVYTGSVAVPFGEALSIAFNYQNGDYSNQGNKSRLGKTGLSSIYTLDKDFSLYSSFSIATGDMKEYIKEKRIIQFGVNYVF